MVDIETEHREILRVPCSEPGTDPVRGCSNQAVGLPQGRATAGEFTPPRAGLPSVGGIDRDDLEPVDELSRRWRLGRAEPADDLLDIDPRGARVVTAVPEGSDPVDGGTAAEIVDQDGGVEQDEHRSAATALVAAPLPPNPLSWVLVPLVPLRRDRSGRCVEIAPTALPGHGELDGATDELAAIARSGELVDFRDEVVVHLDVHAHVLKIAHRSGVAARPLLPARKGRFLASGSLDSQEETMAVDEAKLNEFVGRFVADLGAIAHAPTVLIGDRLGLYRAMGDSGT